MDGRISISPQALYAAIGTAASPLVLDVRRNAAFDADDRMLVSALRQAPEDVGRWWRELPVSQPIAVYCVHGDEVGRQRRPPFAASGATPGISREE